MTVKPTQDNSSWLYHLSCDLTLQDHLKRGGDVTDAVGQELVSQVMDVVMKFPHVSGPTQKLGLTKEDLSQAYTEMIKFLMPEPLVWWHTSFQGGLRGDTTHF